MRLRQSFSVLRSERKYCWCRALRGLRLAGLEELEVGEDHGGVVRLGVGVAELAAHGLALVPAVAAQVHLEPVKAFARLPEDGVCSMEIWMETEAGTKVLEGTASVGCGLTDPLDHPSALAARLARERPPGREGLRIMANLEVGQQSDRIPARYNYGAKLEGMGNLEWGPAQALLTTEPRLGTNA